MRILLVQVAAVAGGVALMSACVTSAQLSKADTYYAEGRFEQAITLYKANVVNGKDAPETNFRIGEAYRFSNRLASALPFYQAALAGKVRHPDVRYHYAQALRAAGQFAEAATQFRAYAQSGVRSPLVEYATAEANASVASLALAGQPTTYEVQPLDALNSSSSDFSAARLPGSGELVFASGREGKAYPGNGSRYLALYAGKLDDLAASARVSRKLEPLFNSPNTLQASATYAPDGKTMVFARSNDGSRKGYRSNDLWVSFYQNGAWTVPALANLNDRTADDFAPAFAPDGTTLYFASNRQGGQGGTDLYQATLGVNGRFSAAENLGAAVNTPGEDSFPGVAPDGTLYFASSGHPGYGQLDLFRVQRGQVMNLGPGINSVSDDFAPYFTGPDAGVFSSNRDGGKGSDDLYAFGKKPRKRVVFVVDGTVLERDPATNATTPVAGETVTLTSGAGQRLEVTTGPDGRFTARLDSAQTYALFAARNGDFSARTSMSTVGHYPISEALTQPQTEISLPVLLTLSKIVMDRVIEVKDIYYDYNQATIRPDAAVRLDTLAQMLLDNPKITIEMSANTDQRGNDAYNLKLSQRRAEAAVAYIVHKGIDEARLTARGYGETRPVVQNPRTPADYQRNRRTEFKVTRISQ